MFSIQLRDGKILSYEKPVVMGIINLTPDSFYSGSRTLTSDSSKGPEAEALLRARVHQMITDGAQMIDVGACSTRPGYTPPTVAEELARLEWGLPIVLSVLQEVGRADQTSIPVSVDTYRAQVAEEAVTRLGADIINDVYSGKADPEMLDVVNRLGAPYIMNADSADVESFFEERLPLVKHAQVILDPGFGFSKSVAQNFEVMQQLPALIARYAEYPMLVGISRKSMIWKSLGCDPEHSLNGTTVLNTLALQAGAHILRVHDVKEAVEAVLLVSSCSR